MNVNIPQSLFLAKEQKFRAFVGGFGSGKTYIGCISQCKHYLEHPRINQGYFAPTYPQIRDIFYPTIEEVASGMGLRTEIREGNKEVHFYSGSAYRGTTICRSMERPSTIIGFKIGRAMVDELDTMKHKKARDAWRKIIARMRYKDDSVQNGIDVTTTPEGFNFTHEMFVESLASKPSLNNTYGIVKASTYDNEANLPDDYIQSLIDTYPDALVSAYLQGDFVNLKTGCIYTSYNRETCNSSETIQPKEPLYIGQDFNVGKMASVVFVKRGDVFHAADELVDLYDTPALIEVIKDRYKEHSITIYPDASGNSRKTVNASESDIKLLRQAGFRVKVDSKNPRVRDRILSVNAALSKGRVFVNAAKCKETARCLEQQAYDKNGEPDKSAGTDHMNDGFGYMIIQELPVIKPTSNVNIKF